MKPPFAYYGGKATLAPWIVSLLPKHRVYVEPFAGSLAVLFAKVPALHEVINDIDSDIVTFFRVLRERADDLVDACELTPYARDEFALAKPDEPVDELERARRFWVRVNQGFNKAAILNNGWSSSVACQNGEPKTVQNRLARLRAAARRLHSVTIENRDACEVIEQYGVADGVIYVDPPYVTVSRVQGLAYAHEMGGVLTIAASPKRSTRRRPPSSSRATTRTCTTSSTATGTAPTSASSVDRATERLASCLT